PRYGVGRESRQGAPHRAANRSPEEPAIPAAADLRGVVVGRIMNLDPAQVDPQLRRAAAGPAPAVGPRDRTDDPHLVVAGQRPGPATPAGGTGRATTDPPQIILSSPTVRFPRSTAFGPTHTRPPMTGDPRVARLPAMPPVAPCWMLQLDPSRPRNGKMIRPERP